MIPNGVDLGRFAFHEEKRKEMRQELGIAEDTFVLGHIGRITVPKNHQFLVELFADYHKENSNSRLLLVGDGELLDTVRQQCAQRGISEAVIMTGSKTNTEDYYLCFRPCGRGFRFQLWKHRRVDCIACCPI